MRLIIGLGNPGLLYAGNRHNVGHLVVDKLSNNLRSQKLKTPKDLIIRKSDAFMNNSGSFVERLVSQYPAIPVSSVYIIHDDLDLPLGTWKMQYAKGPRDQGGINDIEQKLGTKDFWRIRVGIENRDRVSKISGEEYVLQDFTEEEREIIDKAIKEICKKLVTL